MTVKTILLIQYPMPLKRIASWTNMYNYYLRENKHNFDYIVCPEDDEKAPGVTYAYVQEPSLQTKVQQKIDYKTRFNRYFNALDSVIEPNTKYIIHIIDNSGIIAPLNSHLELKHNRKDFYIQYYFQGFDAMFDGKKAEAFLTGIDEMFFLTKMAYTRYKEYYYDLTFRAGVMHNTTNSKLFYKLDDQARNDLRVQLDVKAKFVFVWCSRDTPKKGLHIILDVWKRIYKGDPKEMQLLVVGTKEPIEQEGVRWIGRVPNAELPKYYQVSDFYLFSTLCKEGFGIVLAEALKCGCYCIASDQGGVAEVLDHGTYGKLIENPNFIDEWVDTIEDSMRELEANNFINPFYKDEFKTLYDYDDWCDKMNAKIEAAKINLT